MGYVFTAFVGSLKRTWRGVVSLSLYSWIHHTTTHLMRRVQRTSQDRTNANTAWVFVKTARSCMVSTRGVIVPGTHTLHLPMSMEVRVQYQTLQLPTCLPHSSIILTQHMMMMASISFKRRLLTCVDTVWAGVTHVGSVGMGLRSASVKKILLESTVVRMTVVMKMRLPQSQTKTHSVSPDSTKP